MPVNDSLPSISGVNLAGILGDAEWIHKAWWGREARCGEGHPFLPGEGSRERAMPRPQKSLEMACFGAF